MMKGFWSGKRVTVTGGAGFLVTHLVRRLELMGAEVFVPRQRDYNLTALDACMRCLLEHPCDMLVHSAAYYGGIGINVSEPATLYYRNLVMGANLMEAARLAGVGRLRLAVRHLLPGAVPAVLVTASLDIGALVLTLAGLSFLGLGQPAPTAELGADTARTLSYLLQEWWIPVVPGLAVMVMALIGNVAGDAVRDLLDNRR